MISSTSTRSDHPSTTTTRIRACTLHPSPRSSFDSIDTSALPLPPPSVSSTTLTVGARPSS
eukprot:1501499-Rhodomonas_salina.1